MGGLLGISLLVFRRVRSRDGGTIDHQNTSATPPVAGSAGLFGLVDHRLVDLVQTIQRQDAPRLAVGAGGGRRRGLATRQTQSLGLADGLAAGRPGLGHLPEERPEDQAQGPAALAGVVALVLLGQAPGGNPGAKETLQLVEGAGAVAAPVPELPAKLAGPKREIGRRHGQHLYCPIDNHASLFCMPKTKNASALPPAYRRLRQALAGTAWIALGSLMERTTPGGGGPRYQWSRRVGAKTVTVALSAEQFAWLKQAIANQRKAWNTLMEMQRLTAEYALQNLPNPTRRKPFSKKRLGLN